MPTTLPKCPFRMRAAAAGAAALLCLSALLPAQQPAKKTHLPAAADVAKSRALIDDIFKEDFTAATTPEQKSKLAEYLFQQGKESGDSPANRYTLYVHTRDLAAQAGNLSLALAAIDELDRQFVINALEMKAAVLAAVAEAAKSPEAARDLANVARRLIAQAVEDDQYEAALAVARSALRAATTARSVPLATEMRKRIEEVEKLSEGFARIRGFLTRLKADPTDAEANLELGKYFALMKGKWERALPLLARGGDPELRELAKRDLAAPQKAADQAALADDWWELAQQYEDAARMHLRRRAAYWYEQAAGELAGLNRTKAIRRAEQVAASARPPVTPVDLGAAGKIRELKGHTQEVKAIDFSPDGQTAVSGGLDESVRLWDLRSGKEIRAIKEHTKQVWGVAFHPGGKLVASSSWDATVRLWDVASGKEEKRFTLPIDANGVAFSADGKLLLAGCDDKFMQLFDLTTSQEGRKFTGPDRFVYGVAFSPDGRYVACGSLDQTARVYNRETGEEVRRFDKHNNAVYVVAFSRDGRYLFTCGDAAAHQWEIATGKEVRRFASSTGSWITAMALSRDGRRLVTGGDDKTVRLWDVATGKELQVFLGHADPVSAVAISPDGRYALSGGLDRTIILWGLPER